MTRSREDLKNWHKLLDLIDAERWNDARCHAVKYGFADGIVELDFEKKKKKKDRGITALQSAYKSNDIDYMSSVLGRKITDKSEVLKEIFKRYEKETEELTAPIIVGDRYYFRSYYELAVLTDIVDVKKYAEDQRNSTHILNKLRPLGFDAKRVEEYHKTDNRPFFEELERRQVNPILYKYKGILYNDLKVLALYNEEFHDFLNKNNYLIIRTLLQEYKKDFSVIVANSEELKEADMCDWKREKFPQLEHVKRIIEMRDGGADYKKILLLSRLNRNTFLYVWRKIKELDL